MSSQYQVPLHLCQWCFKTTGRFIIDCLCLACEPCLNSKKGWVDEKGHCFNCNKRTQRKIIDLKKNPQEGGFYFQNVNSSFKNVMRIDEFQQQVTKKYCKHLQSKVKKLDLIIRSFVKQYPQFLAYFDDAFKQMEQKDNMNFRSKSVQTDTQQNQPSKMHIYQSHTQRNLAVNKHHVNKIGNQGSNYPQANFPKNMNHPQYFDKKDTNSLVSSKMSSQASMEGGYAANMYENHGKYRVNEMNRAGYQKKPMIDSSKGDIVRKQPSKMQMDQNKGLIQMNQLKHAYNHPQSNQIYVIGGSKKFSDPSRQQINLNKSINYQTAIRSIKSQDQRSFPPFQSPNVRQMRYKKNPEKQEHSPYKNRNYEQEKYQNQQIFGRKPQ